MKYFTKEKGMEIRDSIKNSTGLKIYFKACTLIGIYVTFTFASLLFNEAKKLDLQFIKVQETTTISKSTTPKAASVALGLPERKGKLPIIEKKEIKIPKIKNIERDLSHIKISDQFPLELIELVPIIEKERIKYNIPISICLAQMYLESGIRVTNPASDLSLVYNNWFGIKYKKGKYLEKLIKAGLTVKSTPKLCNNKREDCAKYIWFKSRWECMRAKSIMINGGRYKKLKGLDYKEFAHGLKKAGYATDKKYAYKLIQTIEKFKLYKYDN